MEVEGDLSAPEVLTYNGSESSVVTDDTVTVVGEISGAEYRFLFQPGPMGQIIGSGPLQIRTMATLPGIRLTIQCIVASSCKWPHIVKGPYDRLSKLHKILQRPQGQKAGIDPVQVNNVCLPDLVPCVLARNISPAYSHMQA